MIKPPFYIRAARVLAPVIIVFGAISLFLGLAVATDVVVEPEPGRYLGRRTSGEAIDLGLYRIIVGIVIGAISEIGYSHFNKAKAEQQADDAT